MSQQKQTVVSFRADHHLAEILNNLPDKSGFIRDAILRRFHAECPFCQGRGVLPSSIADWLSTHMPEIKTIACKCCNYNYPVDALPEGAGQSTDNFVCTHCREHGHTH